MKLIISRITLVAGLIVTLSLSSAALAASSAFIVDSSYAVQKVSSTGQATSKSEENFALNVSVGADGSVWVVSTDAGIADRGGNLLKRLAKGAKDWTTVMIEGGVEITKVSGDAAGNAYVIDGDTHEILHISASGKIIADYTNKEPFLEVSAAFSDTNPSSNQIWAIGANPLENLGNPVYYMTDPKKEWQSRGVGAQDLSGYWTVSSDGQVITAAPDSGEHVMSPKGTASSISVGASGSIWVVSLDANMKQGGAFLKIWNEQGSGAKNWVTVPNIGAFAVSAQ